MLIRAAHDEHTLTVYQAYAPGIAGPAVTQQNLAGPAFKVERMTWIKPSFLWMMYRSGWASKAHQERVLALRIKRTGLDWALQHACLSHFNAAAHASPEA
jgi:predicted aminopeptidase